MSLNNNQTFRLPELHAVNMIDGGDASHSNVDDKLEDFVYRNLIIMDHNINQVLLDHSKSGVHTQTSGSVFDQTYGTFTTQNNNMLATQTNDSELNQGSRNKRSLSDVTEQKSTFQINIVETTDVTNTKHL